jgi:hypothetical protein
MNSNASAHSFFYLVCVIGVIRLKWKRIRIGSPWMRIRIQKNDVDPTGSTT